MTKTAGSGKSLPAESIISDPHPHNYEYRKTVLQAGWPHS
jgi:hypothetical protein